jgi:hypothetical protein
MKPKPEKKSERNSLHKVDEPETEEEVIRKN